MNYRTASNPYTSPGCIISQITKSAYTFSITEGWTYFFANSFRTSLLTCGFTATRITSDYFRKCTIYCEKDGLISISYIFCYFLSKCLKMNRLRSIHNETNMFCIIIDLFIIDNIINKKYLFLYSKL